MRPSTVTAAAALVQGVRYSLIIFSGLVCPNSPHNLVPTPASRMRLLYPDEGGSYHCDGCGDSAATLGRDAELFHCDQGCQYALCRACHTEQPANNDTPS